MKQNQGKAFPEFRLPWMERWERGTNKRPAPDTAFRVKRVREGAVIY